MTQEEIDELKNGNKTIPLDNNEYANVEHADLSTALVIIWRHEVHELLIHRATDKEYLEMGRPFNLKNKNILILNDKHPGHERVYELTIDKEEKKMRLSELHNKKDYGLNITIIDKQ